jgi:hypothetical protein
VKWGVVERSFNPRGSVMYHLGVVQVLVKGVAWVMVKTLDTSGTWSPIAYCPSLPTPQYPTHATHPKVATRRIGHHRHQGPNRFRVRPTFSWGRPRLPS